jgi:hypothetical protein
MQFLLCGKRLRVRGAVVLRRGFDVAALLLLVRRQARDSAPAPLDLSDRPAAIRDVPGPLLNL